MTGQNSGEETAVKVNTYHAIVSVQEKRFTDDHGYTLGRCWQLPSGNDPAWAAEAHDWAADPDLCVYDPTPIGIFNDSAEAEREITGRAVIAQIAEG